MSFWPLNTIPKWVFILWLPYVFAIFCCFGRLFADYLDKEYINYFQFPLWLTSAVGHFISLSLVLYLHGYDVMKNLLTKYRLSHGNQNKASVGSVLGVLLSVAVILVVFTVIYRYKTVLEEFGSGMSWIHSSLLLCTVAEQLLFTIIEGMFLINLLVNKSVFEIYSGNKDKIVHLKNSLKYLAGVNLLFLVYDISWIIFAIVHYKVNHVWLFHSGFHVTHIGTLTFDIIALISLYDIYTYVKFDVERSLRESGTTTTAIDDFTVHEMPTVGFWIRCVKISSWIFFIFSIIRTLVKLDDIAPDTYAGTDVLVAVISWTLGAVTMTCKVILLVKHLFQPFYKSLHQNATSNVSTVLFFIVYISFTTLVNFEQVFEAYEVWLENCPSSLKGKMVIVLGVQHISYAMLVIIEGLIMIWLSNYKEYESIRNRNDILEVLTVAVRSSQLYCMFSILFAVNLPPEKTLTIITRLCGPPLFHFLMSIYYTNHRLRFSQLSETPVHLNLWSSVIELLNIRGNNCLIGLLAAGCLRLLLPSNGCILTLLIDTLYIFVIFNWRNELKHIHGLKMVKPYWNTMVQTILKRDCNHSPLEFVIGSTVPLILLVVVLGIVNRATLSYNRWCQIDAIGILITSVISVCLYLFHSFVALYQGLMLWSVITDLNACCSKVDESKVASFVAHLKQLASTNLFLLLDNLIFTATIVGPKEEVTVFYQCLILFFHLSSYVTITYITSKLRKAITTDSTFDNGCTIQTIGTSNDLISEFKNSLNWIDHQHSAERAFAIIAEAWNENLFWLTVMIGFVRIGLKNSILATVVFRAVTCVALIVLNIHIFFFLTHHLFKWSIWTRIKETKASLLLCLGVFFGLLEVWVLFRNQVTENPLESGMLFLTLFLNLIFILHEVVLLILLVNCTKVDLPQQRIVKAVLNTATRANIGYALYGILSACLAFLMDYNLKGKLNWELFVGQLACSSLVPMMVLPTLITTSKLLTEETVVTAPHEDLEGREYKATTNSVHVSSLSSRKPGDVMVGIHSRSANRERAEQ